MTRTLATLILVCGTASAWAAEPRDSPVLADFSEEETVVEPRETKETLIPKITEAMAAVCGSAAPQDFRTYRGVWYDDYKGEIHYAQCGDRPFGAKHAFAITNGPAVVASGESWVANEVRAIDDLDGDKYNEIILQYTERPIIKRHARVVTYKNGVEEVVQDFGLVFTASDPAFNECRERAAVIFMHTFDPTKMKRKDYGQPCGGEKEWAEIGDADLLGPG